MVHLTYAVGDIHGRFDLLVAALNWIKDDAKPFEGTSSVVMLGDYVDRGPDSAQVIDLLMKAETSVVPGAELICLAGNHELMMLLSLSAQNPETQAKWLSSWLQNGGQDTLDSYLVQEGDEQPGIDKETLDKHLAWIRQLPRIAQDEHRIFVHAFLDPSLPLDEQGEDRLWGRPPKNAVDEPKFRDVFGKQVVHGHTPQRGAPYVSEHRVNLDTGAVFGGKLTVARWIDGEITPTIQQF